MLRAIAVCRDAVYLVGAYGKGDDTRPAAWSSPDGRTWAEFPVFAESYYGVRSVMHTVACRDGGDVAAIGGKPGGAHGNPRVSSYDLVTEAGDGAAPHGVLKEVHARFELFGGPTATNVGRLDAGPDGWIITGNRASGAAVWLSPDAAAFEIVEGAPVLSSSAERATWAADAAAHGGEWVVVGGVVAQGRSDRDPAAWVSADGLTWRSVSVPAEPEYDELAVVTPYRDGLVAVGISGPTFRAWRLDDSGWQAAGRFASTRPTAPAAGPAGAANAADLTASGDHLIAAVADGTAYQLWLSSDGGETWRPVPVRMHLPFGATRAVALGGLPGVGGEPDRVLLAGDDGAAGRLFLAELPES